MEADKSHDLLSASRRPRKTPGIIPSKSKGLRIRRAEDANSTSSAENEMKCASSIIKQIKSFDFCCYLIQALSGLTDALPHQGEQSTKLNESIANLTWKYPHRHTLHDCLTSDLDIP